MAEPSGAGNQGRRLWGDHMRIRRHWPRLADFLAGPFCAPLAAALG
ncbi:hypothetical protein LX15_001398 [Streptoalloteichus tenebrarius]|uniref:Uncharacterized protein n=1 Tax=Streptoalloteichus tenebrarius (strain ATCC 17920 / DSM 40477 / JCM 4838 / CBS 697.72 / NBRC 16177 / NCIMB 11028 / NRRL B-12390 / A12253. 1 / ISP 5477) TaxID=1933 RepID=A0ABT1HQB8_STRSD|nr:hypothetical protein [Streptoalloteichus tenebrarius]MCP2257712.1 hypothetical protein [Streptoalloteichus tenebrarius]BFE99934.1 hypothetical protein GCM10020241_16100 [Streptoalloteichus tenebrarius]